MDAAQVRFPSRMMRTSTWAATRRWTMSDKGKADKGVADLLPHHAHEG
jgi:hypothetical protein